jgi:hypothetical protein
MPVKPSDCVRARRVVVDVNLADDPRTTEPPAQTEPVRIAAALVAERGQAARPVTIGSRRAGDGCHQAPED